MQYVNSDISINYKYVFKILSTGKVGFCSNLQELEFISNRQGELQYSQLSKPKYILPMPKEVE